MNQQISLLPPVNVETAPERLVHYWKISRSPSSSFRTSLECSRTLPRCSRATWAWRKTSATGTLSPVERQIVLLSASVENRCDYCIAAHSTLLKAFLHVPAEVVSAVRSNEPVSDPKLAALIALTKEIVTERGHVQRASDG